jgi:DNA processing protein
MGTSGPEAGLERLLCGGPEPPADAAQAFERWQRADPRERERAARDARRLLMLGVRVLARGAAGYPAALGDLHDPPGFVFVRGLDLPSTARAVAVVGTRAATPYGAQVARSLARGLARAGLAVVSGLARGVDGAAHRGCLDAGGHTVAVLPGGVDAVVPPHHHDLGEDIARRGTLLSEYPAGPPFGPRAFVRRNRLIAALSAATVVVEAGERSGALLTAGFARALGRPCLAVPGDVDRPQSRGCLGLLRRGARVCAEVADVLAALEAGVAVERSAGAPPGDSGRVLAVLGARPARLDALARRAGLATARTLAALAQLELLGLARALPGQRYARAEGGT